MPKFFFIFGLIFMTSCQVETLHPVGHLNKYELVQLTKRSHPNIVNNIDCEDFYSYDEKEKAHHGDDWATIETAQAFIMALNNFLNITEQRHVKVIVNDVSAYNPLKDLGHKTHFTGESVDIRFLTTDGRGSNDISTLSADDIALNAIFVSELRKLGFTKIYTDQGKIPGTQHVPGHKTHLHIAR